MAIACDKCGVETEIPEAFFKQRKSFRRSIRTECPRCHFESKLSGLRRSLLWSLAYGAIGLASVLTTPNRAGGWILLNLFLFEAFLIASIIPHEFGHALVGRRLGLRVFKVYIGHGKTVLKANLLGFQTEFKAVPLGGLTFAAPTNASWFQLKQLVFIFAGPLANILLCAVALLFVTLSEIWDFGRIGSGLVPVQVFFYANFLVLVQNLWPHTSNGPLGKHPTDGKLIWGTIFAKSDDINNRLAARFALEAKECHERNQFAEALVWIEQGLEGYPENPLLLGWRGILLIECRDYEAARRCFTQLLTRDGNPPTVRAMMLNNIAYVDALLGGTDRLTEADCYSQEAMSFIGWMPSVKGTRGTTLLELGRIEEALPLLRESMEQAEGLSGKAQNACFISIGEARRGNLLQSQKYLDEARQLAPTCFMIDRAEQALREASVLA